MESKYDLIIVGGGPGGTAAGVYAARKRLRTLFITEKFGGQSTVSAGIENWIGTINIPGEALAAHLEAHLRAYAENIVDIHEGERVVKAHKGGDDIVVQGDRGTYRAKALLVTTGSHHRRLTIPGADKFEHKGITYCASCDGPIFSGMDVTVVGGGNAAFETVAQLLAYCSSVTLINRSNEFRADPITVEKILANPRVRVIKNVELVEVKGEIMVSSVVYKNRETGETVDLPTQGIFVEIGQIPNTDFIKDFVELNAYGQVIIDPRTQKTNTPGVWSAGDCTDVLYHQNNIAAGDAVRALENIYQTIHGGK